MKTIKIGKQLFATLFLMMWCGMLPAQEAKVDSLERKLAVALVAEKITMLERFIPDPAIAGNLRVRIYYTGMLDSLAGTLTEPAERAEAWLRAGQFYRNASCFEPAEGVLMKALDETGRMKDGEAGDMRARILLTRGQVRVDMSDFPMAAELLTEAGSYFESVKNHERLIKVYSAMVVAYQAQVISAPPEKKALLHERADYFFGKIIDIYPSVSDPVDKIDCLSALVNYSMNRKDYDAAEIYVAKLDSVSRSINYATGIIVAYGLGGCIAERRGDYRLATELSYKAYETALESGNMPDAAKGLANAAFDAGLAKNDALRRKYSLMGVELSKKYDIKSQLWRFLDNLSLLAEAEGKYKQALGYRNECIDVYLDLYNEDNANQINRYAARFESLQKENRINELQSEAEIMHYKSQQKNQLILFLIITVVLAVLIFSTVIIYRRRLARKQRQIAEQRIRELEQEKQLVATRAVLDGETAERTRLARDLHDGLGGMLSVVKLNINDMKEGAMLENTDVSRFDKALKMLDDSIGELRRVAHNMMPDSLSRYGLKAALTDFCDNVVGAEFHYFGAGDRLDPKLEVMIYRTAHELVNNVLKHAGADHINIQVVQEESRIAVSVQDDGCGFDTAAETDGTGLNNIRNRVGSYNGRMEIYSKPGEGTEVNVEFRLPDDSSGELS